MLLMKNFDLFSQKASVILSLPQFLHINFNFLKRIQTSYNFFEILIHIGCTEYKSCFKAQNKGLIIYKINFFVYLMLYSISGLFAQTSKW